MTAQSQKKKVHIPKSGLPGVAWPAMPARKDAAILSLIYQLDESQWWPRDAVVTMQLRQAHAVLVHAARTVPFHQNRLTAFSAEKQPPLTWQAFRQLPIMTRADMQQAGNGLASQALSKDHGKPFDVRTAGSTGQPITVKGTAITALFFSALNLRFHLWHGRDFGGTVAAVRSLLTESLRKSAQAGTAGQWVPGHRSGPMYLFPVDKPVAEQLAWLQKIDPHYLLTFPSNLTALLRLAEQQGVRLPRLHHVVTMSEVLEASTRSLCSRVWGVPVTDAYSCQEAGFIAIQCPEHEHYLVQAESLIVEVLDDSGEPCKPGDVGRVVITDLHNFATPLIRYAQGDYAEVGEPCSKRPGLPVLNRVLGRSRNMLTLPSGEQIWPSFSEAVREWSASLPVQQFRLVQNSLNELDVMLVAERPLAQVEEQALTEAISGSLGHPFEISVTYVSEIPRTKGGKFEDFISLIPDGGVAEG